MQPCEPSNLPSGESFEEQAAFFKALGDPHRLTILAALLRAEEPVLCLRFHFGIAAKSADRLTPPEDFARSGNRK